MKCYYHHNVDAIGTCKSCCKGLCIECAIDVGRGLACKGRCEMEVKDVNALIDSNKKAYSRTSQTYLRSAGLYGLLACAFFFMGLVSIITGRADGLFILFIGIVLSIGAFWSYSSSEKFKNL